MIVRPFTAEQIEKLKQNPYVQEVIEQFVYFSMSSSSDSTANS